MQYKLTACLNSVDCVLPFAILLFIVLALVGSVITDVDRVPDAQRVQPRERVSFTVNDDDDKLLYSDSYSVHEPNHQKKQNVSRFVTMVQKVAENNTLILTIASHDFGRLVKNWACHIKLLNVSNALIVALDRETLELAQDLGMNTYFHEYEVLDSDTSTSYSIGTFNTQSYNAIVYTKTFFQAMVLKAGIDLMFTDIDVPWTYDWSVQLRAFAIERSVQLLGQLNTPFGDVNVGFFLALSCPETVHIFSLLQQIEHTVAQNASKSPTAAKDDQTLFNFLLFCGLSDGTQSPEMDVKASDAGRQSGLTLLDWYLRKRERVHQGEKWDAPLAKTFTTSCPTSGVDLKYGVLAPLLFQTGHKSLAKSKSAVERITENRTIMYHPNYMLVSMIRIGV